MGKKRTRKQKPSRSLPPRQTPPDTSHTGTPDSPSGPTQRASIQIRREETFTSGPLPAPEVLQAYDKIVPGLAARIVTMAEQQAEHRRHLERTLVESTVKRERAEQGVTRLTAQAADRFARAFGLSARVFLDELAKRTRATREKVAQDEESAPAPVPEVVILDLAA